VKQREKVTLEMPEDAEQTTADWPMLALDKLIPNKWNPNEMTDEEYERVKRGIKRLIKKVGVSKTLPLVVRPHRKKKGHWEIIDGEHRKSILEELGHTHAPALILNVNTKIARLLTDQLNHNRGSNDPKKYARYLKALVDEHHMSLDELELELPHSSEDMETMMRAQNIQLDDVMVHGASDEELESSVEDAGDNDWVKVEFRLPAQAAEVVEAEISRISSRLEGKNLRGRALEFMAVGSAQTPLKSIFGDREEKMKRLHRDHKRKKKHKHKDKEAA